MAHTRGSIDHRRKLDERPHLVECPILGGGLRSTITKMQAWRQEHCGTDGFVTSSRFELAPDGMPLEILLVHFRHEAMARDCASTFALPYRPSGAAPP